MIERGMLADFSEAALAELRALQVSASAVGAAEGAPPPAGGPIADLRGLLWCSIDNDDSLDLDQLSVAEAMAGDKVKILVAVADGDSLVKKGFGENEI
ncbi:MAG: hypothetical protein HGA82_01210 [Anaerolineales bacterium]|nr:hypothetical protein [Anaerolineales bacterium]